MTRQGGRNIKLKKHKRVFVGIALLAFGFVVALELGYVAIGSVAWYWYLIDLVISSVAIIAIATISYFLVRRVYRSSSEFESKYRAVVESSPDALASFDQNFVITAWNPGAEELFGYSEKEVIGESFAIMLPDYFAEPGLPIATGLAERGEVRGAEKRLVRKDGGYFHAEISITAVSAGDDETAYICTMRDITERKRVEEELESLYVELDGFAHTVSHALRGPLSVIGLAGNTLEELSELPRTEEYHEDVRELARTVLINVDRATRLIKDLLSLAEAGQSPLVVSDVAVGEVVAQVIEERNMDIFHKGIEVKVADDLGRVKSDRTHIYQVFSNLIGNSIQHSNSADPVIEVLRLDEEREACHRFLVRDNGQGLPEEDLEHIFLRFYKSSATGETGIGLSIVEKIVKLYGEEISAYNNNGACFEFTIRDYEEGA